MINTTTRVAYILRPGTKKAISIRTLYSSDEYNNTNYLPIVEIYNANTNNLFSTNITAVYGYVPEDVTVRYGGVYFGTVKVELQGYSNVFTGRVIMKRQEYSTKYVQLTSDTISNIANSLSGSKVYAPPIRPFYSDDVSGETLFYVTYTTLVGTRHQLGSVNGGLTWGEIIDKEVLNNERITFFSNENGYVMATYDNNNYYVCGVYTTGTLYSFKVTDRPSYRYGTFILSQP